MQDGERDPWLKWFPSDWRGDQGLRLCSLAARGLWMEILMLAHPEEGYLRVCGKAPDVAAIARLVGSTPVEVKRLLAELRDAGVSSVTEDGVIYSRRLVRDAKRRAVNRANGHRGGNPRLMYGRGSSVAKSDIPSDKPSDNRLSNRGASESDKTQKLEARSQNPEPEETQGQEQREDARRSYAVLVRLAHDVLRDIDAGVLDVSEAKAELKVRAGMHRIPYDSGVVTRALDAAEVQGQRRRA